MTKPEFVQQWKRLTRHFSVPLEFGDNSDGLRDEIFGALQHWHIDAVERGISKIIREATDRFFPAIGAIVAAVSSGVGKYERTAGRCGTCGGNGWIYPQTRDAVQKFRTSAGTIVDAVVRCPDCGIPAPNYKPLGNLTPLTYAEMEQLQVGTLQVAQIPNQKPSNAVRSGHGMTALREVAVQKSLPVEVKAS